jgi:phosphotransferase system HPr (HPr) family protein
MNRRHCTLRVGNERGVHGRVATRLAEIAEEYGVTLQINRAEETVDCSSILDILAMALIQGSEISLQAEGENAASALSAASAALTSQDNA